MGKAQKLKEQRKLEKILEENKKKKKRKKIETIAVVVILILIIGAGAVFYFSRVQKEKNIVIVNITTEKGEITLELYKKVAPKTVDNFIKLTEDGFYNDIAFHRVIPNFVIQSGDPLSKDDDPTNDGTGGPGYTFEDEINPASLGLSNDEIDELERQGYSYNYSLESIPHDVGVISMANSGPNTNGSQFFIITTESQSHLNGRHTVFGRVIKGMDVVQKIEQGDIMESVNIVNN